jgi:ComF family protein
MLAFIQTLTDLLYPDLCLSCDSSKKMPKDIWCATCAYKTSPTDHHLHIQNPVTERFYGRVKIERAGTLFVFSKGSPLQNLVHKLKYKNRPEIGVELGKLYGGLLSQQNGYDIDVIVPVPMHQKKEFERGYNQAAVFGQGLAETMRKPLSTKDFIKTKSTISQTTKTRTERLDNVKDVFYIANAANLVGKHILLIDDVITTGATLESCANILLELPNTRVSIACIALASG